LDRYKGALRIARSAGAARVLPIRTVGRTKAT